MKKLFTVLILLLSFMSLYSSPKSFIKLYFNNGKQSQVFLIDDIGKMAIKKFSNNFTLTVYYQKSLSAGYQTSTIDTMKFENNDFNIYLSGSIKSYLVSEIDSLIFRQNTDAETVTICNQVWMTKNLDVDHYRNGDTIRYAGSYHWVDAGIKKEGAWCYYYDYYTANGEIYGKLYNWYAVNDPRGLAPDGWHIPTDDEWTELETCLGGDSIAGGKLKSTGTIDSGDGLWYSPNTGATNESGFSGLPGGYRNYNGESKEIGYKDIWWSSTEVNEAYSWYRSLYYFNNSISRNYDDPVYGFSVRCVRDK